MNIQDAQKEIDELVELFKSHCIEIHLRSPGEYGWTEDIKLTDSDHLVAVPMGSETDRLKNTNIIDDGIRQDANGSWNIGGGYPGIIEK